MSQSNTVATLPTARTVDADNPWPGPEAFREADEKFFFGRARAIEEVSRLVTLNRLVVLYGRSGLGKTSLLRAGVFPKVRKVSGLPVYVRIDFGSALAPRQQLREAIESALARDHIESAPIDGQATLWEWFYHSDMQFFNERSRRLRPVLVLDQFEEAFTHGGATAERTAATAQFLEELIDLVRGNVPASVAKRFEEHPDAALDFSPNRDPCGILIALRQEFLPELLRLRPSLPTLLDRRFELTAMTPTDAELVITNAGGHLVEPGVAPAIVSFVAGARRTFEDQAGDDATVDPAILSIFCRELNTKRRKAEMPKITEKLVVGSQNEIIADFYRGAVLELAVDVRKFIEERLVTESGFRDSVAVDDSLAASGLTEDVIKTLTDRRIVRIIGTGNRARLELTHDVLADPIVQIRKVRRVQEQERATRDVALKRQREEFEAQELARKEQEKQRELEATRALLEKEQQRAELAQDLARQKEQEKEAAQQRAVLAQEKIQALKLQRRFAVAALLFGVAFLSLLGWGYYRAQSSVHTAEANVRAAALLSQAQALRNSVSAPLQLSLLLGLEALRNSQSLEAMLHVTETARLLAIPAARLEHGGEVRSIVISRSEQYGATLAGGNDVVVWRLPSGQRHARLTHEAEVQSVGFSSDTRVIGTLSGIGSLTLWDLSGTMLARLPPPHIVNGLAFGAGNRLAVAEDDGVVLFDVSDARAPREIGRGTHDAAAHLVAFSPDGNMLASAGDDIMKVWSIEPDGRLRETRALRQGKSARALAFIDRPTAVTTRLAWNESAGVLVCIDERATLRLWNVPVEQTRDDWQQASVRVPERTELSSNPSAILRLIPETEEAKTALERIAKRADGETNSIVMSGLGFLSLGGQEAAIWNIAGDASDSDYFASMSSSRERREVAMPAKSDVLSAAVAENAGYIVTGHHDGAARVWLLHDNSPTFVAVSENGLRAVLDSGIDLAWSGTPFRPPFTKLEWEMKSTPRAIGLSADGNVLAAANRDKFSVWNLDPRADQPQKPSAVFKWEDDGPPLPSIVLAPGAMLVGRTKSVQLYSTSTGKITWRGERSGLAGIALSPDARRVAAWTQSGELNLWTVTSADSTQKSKLVRVGPLPSRVAFDPSGAVLGACAGQRELILMDTASGARRKPVQLSAACGSFAFDRKGQNVVIGAKDGSITITDLKTRNARKPLSADAQVTAVASSPTSSLVAAVSHDGVARVWQVESGAELARIFVGRTALPDTTLAFSGDEQKIFVRGRLYDWRPTAVLEDACRHVARNLSDDERARYRLPKVASDTCKIAAPAAVAKRPPGQ